MKPILTFTTSRPPSKKNNMVMWKGRLMRDPKVQRAEGIISILAMKAMQDCNWPRGYKGPVEMEVIYSRAGDKVGVIMKKAPAIFGKEVKRKFDLQNLADSLCDGIEQSGAIENDKQIVRITIRELAPKKG